MIAFSISIVLIVIPGGILSPEAHECSLDEGFDSEDDSDHDEDDSSDAGMFTYPLFCSVK